ncbi:hypothetical protein [Natronolimnobius baerhuensis]|uniref:Uncharacterized protein n=1 Tax=Natronolimnobius baerhuensis TaxID=253108 RepID=A0A202E4M6_9EURY|nr:hypothetical protein [Natronolimnobius baerhuensis]OVE83187.1 hypothetical protein B2G88_17415 [Natronolimnobius baerhuensis]
MNRRKILLASGVTLSTVLAGCAGDEDDTANGDDPEPEDDDSDDTNGNGDDNGNGEEPEEDEPESDDDPNGDDVDDTDEDTDEEEDEAEDVDEPEPQTFSGSGAAVESGIDIVGNLTVVDAEHQGESNFQVSLVGDGEFDDNFVNEIGDYAGETADLIDAGEYMLDVEADGNWEVEIRQPRAASGDSLPQSLEDDRNRVLGAFEFDGTHVAEGSHSGESNFAVHVYAAEAQFGELVFNEIGQYEGETTFGFDGVGWVAVVADGDWSLELE